MTETLQYMTGRKVSISIVEIKNPDMDAQLVAEGIAEQLTRRASYRRIVKMRGESCMQAGARGVRIQISGRLGGAEMSRRFDMRLGALPLSTLQANVQYGFAKAVASYGVLGVKTWLFKGLFEEGQQDEVAPDRSMRARGRR